MAKEELEEYEEEEVQEENLDDSEQQLRRLNQQMNHISRLMCKMDPTSSDYNKLSMQLESLSRTKTNIEEGRNFSARQREAKSEWFLRLLTAGAPILGAIVGEGVKQHFEMKKVNRITDYEKENVITTKAIKYCK